MKGIQGNHTPEPWETEYSDGHTTQIKSTVTLETIADVDTHALTDDGYVLGGAEYEANANLIAAAPELLAALEMLMSWTMRDGTPCCCAAGKDEDEQKGKMPTMHSTACEDSRAAIAKAHGRA